MLLTSTRNSLRFKKSKQKKNKILFYSLMIAFPLLQFLVFYVYININSILLAFQTEFKGSTPVSYGFDNFKFAWNYLTTYSYRFKNTIIFFLVNLFVDIPMSLITSYYFFKKRTASGLFKVMLFLPQIISAMVMGVLYRYVFTSIAYEINPAAGYLLYQDKYQLLILLGFNLFMSFGVNTLVFSGAMSALNTSVMESSELDGCGSFRQFTRIVIPMIFPTLSTMLVMALSVIFIEQFQVYTIFGVACPESVDNIGYQIYYLSLTNMSGNFDPFFNVEPTRLSFPQLAALGLILTLFILPITLLFRRLLDKIGEKFE